MVTVSSWTENPLQSAVEPSGPLTSATLLRIVKVCAPALAKGTCKLFEGDGKSAEICLASSAKCTEYARLLMQPYERASVHWAFHAIGVHLLYSYF